MKRCCRCKTERPLTEFCKDKQSPDGLSRRCRECRNAMSRERHRKNPAGSRARSRRWEEAHPKQSKAIMRAWREQHPGYSAEANRKWREQNPDANAAYYQANREAARERYLKRRAIKKAATVGEVDAERLWADSNGTCGICREPIDRSIKGPNPLTASIDHIVPLSKGGTHEQANLQWAHLVCNKRKGARVPEHCHLGPPVAPSEGSGSHQRFVS